MIIGPWVVGVLIDVDEFRHELCGVGVDLSGEFTGGFKGVTLLICLPSCSRVSGALVITSATVRLWSNATAG
jgi:hypothetical protein